jgi:hypothetical protein
MTWWSPYAELAVGRMILQHMAVFVLLYGATWPSHGLPCGTLLLVLVVGLKVMESVGIEPQTSPHACKVFEKSALPMHHTMCLVIYVV